MTKEKTKMEKEEKAKVVGTSCKDRDCHIHGNLKVRGKTFEGKVIRKFHKRITIELEKMIYVPKYERYAKSRTRVHARLPVCMEKEIELGDLVQIRECRPLSKIIHFVVVKKIKSGGEK
jgi:small subunit ribosomal protein S17